MRPSSLKYSAFLLTAAWTAFAQTQAIPSFQLERLQLNTGGGASLLIGTGELLPQNDFRLSFIGAYEHRPLVYFPAQGASTAVVSSRIAGGLSAAYSPLAWLELGLDVPIIANQAADNASALGFGSGSSVGLGAPLLSSRLQLVTIDSGAPADLAAQIGVSVPLGSAGALTRDSSAALIPKLMAGRGFGPIRAGLELGAWIRPKVSLSGLAGANDEVGSELQIGGTIASVGARLTGELGARAAVPFTRQPAALELFGGGRYALGSRLEVFALGGPGFGTSPGTPAFRVICGVGFHSAPAAAPPQLAVHQLPKPVENPCAPGNRHSPEQCPDLDDDGDGIPNKADRCPTEPGTAAHFGCPFADQDGDGIEDSVDACPTQPGPAETHGCPDADGDGIADYMDNCPYEKGPADNQGCPVSKKQLVVITKDKLIIKDKLHFASGVGKLLPDSSRLLDQIASVIAQHPSIAVVSIEGHTDSRGSAKFNQGLSEARAKTVHSYLIKSGIEPGRLRFKGYGSDHPVATNQTDEGREANRRVEFVIPSAGESS